MNLDAPFIIENVAIVNLSCATDVPKNLTLLKRQNIFVIAGNH